MNSNTNNNQEAKREILKPTIRARLPKSCSASNPKECDFVTRIIHVLEIYRKWRVDISSIDSISKPMFLRDTISNSMNGYQLPDIMNDFQHLLRFHSSNTIQMEQIHDEILLQFGGVCDLKDCRIYQRNNRRDIEHTTNVILKENYEMFENSDVCLQQKLDVIHCYCVHSFEMLRLTSKEEERIRNSTIVEDVDAKENYDLEHEEGIAHDLMIGTMSKIMHSKQETVASIIEQPATSKFVTIVESNEEKKNVNNEDEREVISSVYAFSKRFYYWPYFQNLLKKDRINGKKVKDWFIPLVFQDLKEEMIGNKILAIELIIYLADKHTYCSYPPNHTQNGFLESFSEECTVDDEY